MQNFDSLFGLMDAFPDEQACIDHLVQFIGAAVSSVSIEAGDRIYHFSDRVRCFPKFEPPGLGGYGCWLTGEPSEPTDYDSNKRVPMLEKAQMRMTDDEIKHALENDPSGEGN
ncbi:hypothetical protein [Labrys neptuniae]